MVIGRALEKDGAPGLRIVPPEANKPMGGHAHRIMAEYAKTGSAAAVLLHETYQHNLGIFSSADEGRRTGRPDGDEERTLVFFLGAVKDMSSDETTTVQKACRAANVRCVTANL